MNVYEVKSMSERLEGNTYPGRGIVLGITPDGTKAVAAYFIMGRSVNSRNRVFIQEPDGIRTEAYDPSKLEDPSLIIYHPVREVGRGLIVTNGDQTDPVRDFLCAGKTFEAALRTREFEPDAPNYTPRISGLVAPDGSYKLSILKSLDGDPSCCTRQFFEYEHPVAGTGHFLHTYRTDGDPLPSFDGEPECVSITAPTAAAFAETLWSSLNADNKISLFVRYLDCETGEAETVIRNKNGDETT